MTKTGTNRRKEVRSPASGLVRIIIQNDFESSLEGELLDISKGGFRMAHTQPGLERGAEVQFRHPLAEGRARVLWNRLFAGKSETGFLILED